MIIGLFNVLHTRFGIIYLRVSSVGMQMLEAVQG